LVWRPPPHIPYIFSPNQCLLFARHAHTIATCFAIVSILYHLFLVFLLCEYGILKWRYVNILPSFPFPTLSRAGSEYRQWQCCVGEGNRRSDDTLAMRHRLCGILVHGQVTIIFVVSVGLSLCLFVCLCRVFLSRL